MSAFPTPYTVGVRAYAPTTDAHGNDRDAWGAAVTQAVHGYAPPTPPSEPFEAGRDAVLWDLDVYCPPGFAVGPHDRVVVDGVEYDVVGGVEDFTHGPWQWAAGLRVSLKRAEG